MVELTQNLESDSEILSNLETNEVVKMLNTTDDYTLGIVTQEIGKRKNDPQLINNLLKLSPDVYFRSIINSSRLFVKELCKLLVYILLTIVVFSYLYSYIFH